jgi:hypothetical protein
LTTLLYIIPEVGGWRVSGPFGSDHYATLTNATVAGVAKARAEALCGEHVELLSKRPDGAFHVVWSSLEESG